MSGMIEMDLHVFNNLIYQRRSTFGNYSRLWRKTKGCCEPNASTSFSAYIDQYGNKVKRRILGNEKENSNDDFAAGYRNYSLW